MNLQRLFVNADGQGAALDLDVLDHHALGAHSLARLAVLQQHMQHENLRIPGGCITSLCRGKSLMQQLQGCQGSANRAQGATSAYISDHVEGIQDLLKGAIQNHLKRTMRCKLKHVVIG